MAKSGLLIGVMGHYWYKFLGKTLRTFLIVFELIL